MEKFTQDVEQILQHTREGAQESQTPPTKEEEREQVQQYIRTIPQVQQDDVQQSEPVTEEPMGVPSTYDSVSAYKALTVENKEMIKEQIHNTVQKGVVQGVRDAKKYLKDPVILDAYHDVLVDIVLHEIEQRNV